MRAQSAIASRWPIKSSRERATRKNRWVNPPEPVSVGEGARGIAECRMRGDVVDPPAVDPDLAPVAQALEIFGPGERATPGGDSVFGFLPAHRCSSLACG